MILVNGEPVLSLKEDDKRRQWYEGEMNKIRKIKSPVVIKRPLNTYSFNKDGLRKRPPVTLIQSRSVVNREGNREMWACCETYTEKEKGVIALRPNTYGFTTERSFDPATDTELIFYFTKCVNLGNHGYMVEDIEEEAKSRNEEEALELDVRYAIQKQLDLQNLRYLAKSWGITEADKVPEQALRLQLKELVFRSEKNKDQTKRGFKEFMDDVQNENPEFTEARFIVNDLVSKGSFTFDRLSRRWKYGNDFICMVPLENRDYPNDFLARALLEKKFEEFYVTLKADVLGTPEEVVYSVADVEAAKDRKQLFKIARGIGHNAPSNIGEQKLRDDLIAKLSKS